MKFVTSLALALCGGPVAEEIYLGRPPFVSWENDFVELRHLIDSIKGIDHLSVWLCQTAERELEDPVNWATVRALASALLTRGTLKAGAASRIMRGTIRKMTGNSAVTNGAAQETLPLYE